MTEAEQELVDAQTLCAAQFDARLEACGLLGEEQYDPQLDPADFVDPLSIGGTTAPNTFFPLSQGNVWVYETGDETTTVTVTDETIEVNGITCVVITDIAEADGELIESTEDYYAQDISGNIWYCGELAQNFENGMLDNLDGSFRAGVDRAKPGIVNQAMLVVGDVFRQEWALAEAEDIAEVMRGGRRANGSQSRPKIRARRHIPVSIGKPTALCFFCVIGLWCAPVFSRPALAQTAVEPAAQVDRDRRYITREERRDEAPKHAITSWLTWAALLEAEHIDARFDNVQGASHSRARDTQWTAEAVIVADPLPWLRGEVVYEYDSSSGDVFPDEATAAIEAGDFELEFGRLFVPFGDYLTHFVTDPILQFGETRGRGALLSYGPDDRFDFSAFVYQGLAGKNTHSRRELDWGMALEVAPSGFSTLGLSYISDLADSEQEFLGDNDNRFAARVAGLSGHLILGTGPFEFSAEFVRALDSFQEFNDDRDQPRAWNTELAYYPFETVGLALRYERSMEFENAPRRQVGLAVLLKPFEGLFLTLEYLVGDYRRGLARDAQERDLDTVHQFGALITLEI